MNTGMLWLDNDKNKMLSTKIDNAVAYYRKKYKRVPTLCLVNPGALDGTQVNAPVTVRAYRPILPGHLWIGVDDAPEKG